LDIKKIPDDVGRITLHSLGPNFNELNMVVLFDEAFRWTSANE